MNFTSFKKTIIENPSFLDKIKSMDDIDSSSFIYNIELLLSIDSFDDIFSLSFLPFSRYSPFDNLSSDDNGFEHILIDLGVFNPDFSNKVLFPFLFKLFFHSHSSFSPFYLNLKLDNPSLTKEKIFSDINYFKDDSNAVSFSDSLVFYYAIFKSRGKIFNLSCFNDSIPFSIRIYFLNLSSSDSISSFASDFVDFFHSPKKILFFSNKQKSDFNLVRKTIESACSNPFSFKAFLFSIDSDPKLLPSVINCVLKSGLVSNLTSSEFIILLLEHNILFDKYQLKLALSLINKDKLFYFFNSISFDSFYFIIKNTKLNFNQSIAAFSYFFIYIKDNIDKHSSDYYLDLFKSIYFSSSSSNIKSGSFYAKDSIFYYKLGFYCSSYVTSFDSIIFWKSIRDNYFTSDKSNDSLKIFYSTSYLYP